MKVIQLVLLLSIIPLIKAHGAMVRPAGWSDTDKVMWEYDSSGNRTNIGCGKLDLPEDSEFELALGEKPDCIKFWFSSSEIPGEGTVSTKQMQPEDECFLEQTGSLYHKYPWSAPGTAPVFSPCGAMGVIHMVAAGF